MSETAAASAEPVYVARLALRSTPFAKTANKDSFFKDGQSGQRLNLLLHLLRASDKIAVIQAAAGLGKTTLIEQLTQRSSEELKLCWLTDEARQEPQRLQQTLLQTLGVESAHYDDSADIDAVLRKRLIQLRRINIVPVLLVDDVETLPASVWQQIATWLGWQEDKQFLLQAVLTSKVKVALPMPAQERAQLVDLPPLEPAEVAAYLLQRLQGVGYQGELPFTEKQLKQFYQQSRGNPAKLNQLAHQQLLGLRVAAQRRWLQQLSLDSIGRSMRWLGVIAVLILITVLLANQQQINQWVASKQKDIEESDTVTLPAQEKLATVVVGDDKVKSAEQAERDELKALVAEIPDVQSLPTEQQKSEPEQAVSTSTATVMDEPATGMQPAEVAQKEIAPSAEQSKPPVVETKPGSETSAVHNRDWIMQQKSNFYTFQLMGSWEHQEVVDFIDKYALTGDVAEFESMRNGRVWYALIYGLYSNKQAALAASEKWPAPLNTLPSWLRRFDSVQKQITDKAPKP